jgi:hypothetical protein
MARAKFWRDLFAPLSEKAVSRRKKEAFGHKKRGRRNFACLDHSGRYFFVVKFTSQTGCLPFS